MKTDWQTKTLGELCTKKPAKNEARKKLKSNDLVSFVPMEDLGIQSKNLNLSQIRKLGSVVNSYTYFADGDVLLAKITPCFENGKLGIARNLQNGIGFGSSEFIVLRSKGQILSEYLFYFLLQDSIRIEGKKVMSGAVGHKRVPKEFIESQILSYPESLPEQRRIVAILDKAFAAIEKAKENAEKNLQNAQELFESYLQSVFIQPGEGWVAHRLGDIFEIGSSKRILEAEWTDVGIPFYGGREIVMLSRSETVISNAHISEEKYRDYASKYDMPRQDDIMITARGTIGVGYIVKEGDKFYYKDGNIISMREKMPTNPHFVLYAFRSNAMADQVRGLTGTTVSHLPINKAKDLILWMPEFASQNTVVGKIRKMENETQRLESFYTKKLSALDELKQSLLKKAFAGEL